MKYPPLAVFLHWLCALVILWALASGYLASTDLLPKEAVEIIHFVNVSLTGLLIPIFALRIIYRLTYAAPEIAGTGRSHQRVAHIAHGAIYAVALTSLTTGWLMMEDPIHLFNIAVMPTVFEAGDITEQIAVAHHGCNVLLALLLILHVAAVIHHHWQGRPVLKRMSLGLRQQ